jgi:hypothetical protein
VIDRYPDKRDAGPFENSIFDFLGSSLHFAQLSQYSGNVKRSKVRKRSSMFFAVQIISHIFFYLHTVTDLSVVPGHSLLYRPVKTISSSFAGLDV